MTCRQVVELVTDYLEGGLPADDRRRFEQHLADCPACLVYVAQIRHTIEVLGVVSVESLSPRARAELLEAFRGWRDG
jgi:anti-sigma factor RsiW